MNSTFKCRSCGGSHGELVLDLGLQPLANNLLRPEDIGKPEPKFPLRVAVCHQCWLLQITDLVPPTQLFSEYLYFSSFSDAMLRHARAAVEQHIREFQLGPQSQVVTRPARLGVARSAKPTSRDPRKPSVTRPAIVRPIGCRKSVWWRRPMRSSAHRRPRPGLRGNSEQR